jgi:hypothetical protein
MNPVAKTFQAFVRRRQAHRAVAVLAQESACRRLTLIAPTLSLPSSKFLHKCLRLFQARANLAKAEVNPNPNPNPNPRILF